MKKSWLWDVKRTDQEVREILKNPSHASFIHYAALLLSRSNVPKEVFMNYVSRDNFCRYWRQIKHKMRKNKWNQDRIVFWDEIYKHLSKGIKAKDIKVRPIQAKHPATDLQREVGEAIKASRLSSGMTQQALAQKAGVHQQVISKIEKGTANPSLKTIARIRKCLNGPISINMTESTGHSMTTS